MDDVMFAHNGANRPEIVCLCCHTSTVFGQYLCNSSLLTLMQLQHIDSKLLAMVIYTCSSFGDGDFYFSIQQTLATN